MSVATKARTKRNGNVVVPVEPMFITLTGSPANRSPFRIVRSDKLDELKNHQRLKVERADHIISIELPADSSASDVAEYEKLYGIEDATFAKKEVDGVTTFTRRSDEGIDLSTTTVITMPKGEKVVIARSDDDHEDTAVKEVDATINAGLPAGVREDEAGAIIRSLMSYRFDCTQFTTAEAVAYVEDMGLTDMVVSYSANGSIILSKTERSDTDPEIDFRLVIDNGVLAELVTSTTTTRSDDVLAVTVVSEEPNPSDMAYFGRWGWYASTFANAIADNTYSEKVSVGLDLLSDVLRNIMMWQYEFSPSEVKGLMEESLDYAKTYFGQLLDALPAPTQRSDNTRGNNMALTKEDKLELAQMIAESVAAAETKRADTERLAKEAEDRKRADEEAARLDKEQKDEIVRLRSDIEALKKGGVVTERADGEDPVIDGDTTVNPTEKEPKETKRSDTKPSVEDVFAGVFGEEFTEDLASE